MGKSIVELFKRIVELFKRILERKKEKREAGNKIIIIGLPNSGKTVFFFTMIIQLQKEFNLPSIKYTIRSCNRDGSNLGSEFHKTIQRGVWPVKTTTTTNEHTTFSYQIISENAFFQNIKTIDYTDYPGEVYRVALADPSTVEDHLLKEFENDAAKIMLEIVKAYGVFILVDAVELLEEKNSTFNNIVYGLSDILSNSKVKRVALIFTKTDLCPSKTKEDLIESLNNQNCDTLLQLKKVKHFESFMVSAVETEVNLKGIRVPIQNYSPGKHSKGLLEAIKWMLDLKGITIKPIPCEQCDGTGKVDQDCEDIPALEQVK